MIWYEHGGRGYHWHAVGMRKQSASRPISLDRNAKYVGSDDSLCAASKAYFAGARTGRVALPIAIAIATEFRRVSLYSKATFGGYCARHALVCHLTSGLYRGTRRLGRARANICGFFTYDLGVHGRFGTAANTVQSCTFRRDGYRNPTIVVDGNGFYRCEKSSPGN
jgi:hypothetical protein